MVLAHYVGDQIASSSSEATAVFTITTEEAAQSLGSMTIGLGQNVRHVGDLNHDGVSDFALSSPSTSPHHFDFKGQPGTDDLLSAGMIFVIWGKLTWTNTSSWPSLAQFPNSKHGLIIQGSLKTEYIDLAIGDGGCDMNNDGTDDLIFKSDPTNTIIAGTTVWIVFGRRRWPALISTNEIIPKFGVKIIIGTDDMAHWTVNFGDSVQCIGDQNGDKFGDLMISDHTAQNLRGRVVLLYGRATWPADSTINISSLSPNDGSWVLFSSITTAYKRAWLGRSLGVVDLNADGINDLVLSADGADSTRGHVHVIWGTGKKFPWNMTLPLTSTSQGVYFAGLKAAFKLGYSIATGDVNGDKFTDLVLGNSISTTTQQQVGVALASASTAWGLNMPYSVMSRVFSIYDPTVSFGYPAMTCGDINSDGFDDIFYSTTASQMLLPRVYIVFGGNQLSSFTINANDTTDGYQWARILYSSWGGKFATVMTTIPTYNSQADQLLVPASNNNVSFLFRPNTCMREDINGLCTQCLVGYGLDSALGTCTACDSSTSSYSDGTIPCKSSTKVEGCETYNTMTGKCMRCKGAYGFNYIANNCTKCGGHQWSDGADQCEGCQTTSDCIGECHEITGMCVRCPAGKGLDGLGCKQCSAGFWGSGTTECLPCITGIGGSACLSCESTTGKCLQCTAGYGLKSTGKCEECSNSWSNGTLPCKSCLLGSIGNCLSCNTTTGRCDIGCEPGNGFSAEQHFCSVCTDGLWSDGTVPCESCNCTGSLKCLATTGECTPCSVGEGQKPNNATCVACLEGQWSLGKDICHSCSTGRGGNDCVACNSESGVCTQCTTGSGLVGGVCTKCSAGNWSDGLSACVSCSDINCRQCRTDTGACVQCMSGYGLFSGGICVKCPSGYFSNGTSSCTRCLGGSACIDCNSETGRCSQCTSGSGFDNVFSQCTRCLDGNFSTGKTPCEHCSCQKCDLSSGNCTLCFSGDQPKNETDCEHCHDGMWSSGTKCQPCSTGVGGSHCLACDRTNGVCNRCTAGHGVLPDGHCESCSPNSYFSDGNVPCFPCSLGPGGAHCTTCSSTNGTCTQCNAGYGISSTNHTCNACKAGSFSNGTTDCKPCSTTSAKCVSCDSQTGECTKCTAGSGLDSGVCSDCLVGTFSDGSSNLVCTSCVIGVGGLNCRLCNPKTGSCSRCIESYGFKAISTKTTCRACSGISYSFGNTSCLPCGTGCNSCNSGTGYCWLCNAGYGLMNGVCSACGVGWFSKGVDPCSECSKGSGGSACYRCDSKSGVCSSCVVGYGFSSGSCTRCKSGWWSRGESACAQCKTGLGGDKCLECDSQSGSCLTCDTGYEPLNGFCVAAVNNNGGISSTVIGIIAGGASLGGIIIILVILAMVIVLVVFKRKKTVDLTAQMPSIIMAPIRTSGSSSGPAPEYSIGLESMGDGVNPPIYSLDQTDIMMVPPPLTGSTDIGVAPMTLTPGLADMTMMPTPTTSIVPPPDSVSLSNGSGLQ